MGCVYKLVEINGKPKIKLSQDVEKVTMPGKKAAYRYSRAGQNFWGLISQTPNRRLTQNVKAYQVSGPTRDV